MSVVIGGERSGAGKTTITLALLAALKQRQISVQSFKVGPDYIDPMFHTSITGRPCRNLDPILTSETYVQQCFSQQTQSVACAVVEGVMGLFDGAGGNIQGQPDFASTAHIARLLNLPILLVIDSARLSRSVAAIAQGCRSLDTRLQIAGVVLNRVASDRHFTLLQEALAEIHMPILGVFRRDADVTLPDRHLGLVPTEELSTWKAIQARLAHLGEQGFDWDVLLPLLQAKQETTTPTVLPSVIASTPSSQTMERTSLNSKAKNSKTIRIAIARDRAFNFYYADNLDALSTFGAEIIEFSPLQDLSLPANIQGLYFGGGFPEVFAAELAANLPLRTSVHQAIEAGLPTYAECGGLMYLCEQLVTFDQQTYAMVGILPTTTVMSQRLTLGYRRAEVQPASPFLVSGTAIAGHEFHRSQLLNSPQFPLFKLQSFSHPQSIGLEGWGIDQQSSRQLKLHASYLHLHWGADPRLLQGWLGACSNFRPLKIG